MLTAITRAVSPSIIDAQLTYLPRVPIDIELATKQHRDYENFLKQSGINVLSLPVQPYMPDAVFVEDPAVIVDEIAVITPMGTPARTAEVESIISPLSAFRALRYLKPPAKLEGGDVLRIERTLYVGNSSRTNEEGISQLRNILKDHSYEIISVKVTGCLHLKTACTYLGNNTILINSNWVDSKPFSSFRLIEVPEEESFGANTLFINGRVLIPSAFSKTTLLLQKAGFNTVNIDISELSKAEAGLTCMSLIFNDKLKSA